MPSPDSWIDLSEVARLVRQILPSTPAPEDPRSPGQTYAGPLVGSTPVMPWNIDPTETFPELDDLDLPADPDLERLATLPTDELRNRATRAMRALHAVAARRPNAQPANQGAAEEAPRPADPEPGATSFPASQGKLRERLSAYADWVTRVTGCVALRIVDAQGYSMLEREGDNDPRMVDCALKLIAALEQARERMTPDSARAGLYIPLGDEEWLGVLECETPSGRMCISLVTRAPLSNGAAAELIDSLRRTVEQG